MLLRSGVAASDFDGFDSLEPEDKASLIESLGGKAPADGGGGGGKEADGGKKKGGTKAAARYPCPFLHVSPVERFRVRTF